MSYKKKLVKQRLHKAAEVLPNKDKTVLDRNKEILARQAKIDQYNEECFTPDPRFRVRTYQGNKVIVRLFKEDYIKNVHEVGDLTIYDAWFEEVEVQRYGQNKQKWIENPLPYVYSGVVVAISPEVTAEYLKRKKAIEEVDPELAKSFKVLSVGDEVEMEWFDLQSRRYYFDKQKTDKLKNPEEFSVDNYEGYVAIHYSQIESIK
jgi:hypothetical protein